MVPSAHYEYETPPPHSPDFFSACSPRANFCRSASGMDGMHQMFHKAFISLRRLRARRINLLLLGPLPLASRETGIGLNKGRTHTIHSSDLNYENAL